MEKNNKTYKTIGEVSKEISINTTTLRFWEKQFKQIKPKILYGKIIYELLKNQGYTITGAKKILNNSSIKLDDELSLGVQKKNFQGSIKIKALKIKEILKRIKGIN